MSERTYTFKFIPSAEDAECAAARAEGAESMRQAVLEALRTAATSPHLDQCCHAPSLLLHVSRHIASPEFGVKK